MRATKCIEMISSSLTLLYRSTLDGTNLKLFIIVLFAFYDLGTSGQANIFAHTLMRYAHHFQMPNGMCNYRALRTPNPLNVVWNLESKRDAAQPFAFTLIKKIFGTKWTKTNTFYGPFPWLQRFALASFERPVFLF